MVGALKPAVWILDCLKVPYKQKQTNIGKHFTNRIYRQKTPPTSVQLVSNDNQLDISVNT